jgi:iron complex outermembrane receptor protein
MVQGNSYRHSSKELLPISTALDPSGGFPVSFVFEGSNLLARRSWGMAGGDATLQAYVDHTDARLNAQGNGKIDIVDVDFQHTLAPMGRHELMWGLGARYGRVDASNSPAFTFKDPVIEYRIASAFVQDEISLVPQTWMLTLGSRFEHSTISDFEPSRRAPDVDADNG